MLNDSPARTAPADECAVHVKGAKGSLLKANHVFLRFYQQNTQKQLQVWPARAGDTAHRQ